VGLLIAAHYAGSQGAPAHTAGGWPFRTNEDPFAGWTELGPALPVSRLREDLIADIGTRYADLHLQPVATSGSTDAMFG